MGTWTLPSKISVIFPEPAISVCCCSSQGRSEKLKVLHHNKWWSFRANLLLSQQQYSCHYSFPMETRKQICFRFMILTSIYEHNTVKTCLKGWNNRQITASIFTRWSFRCRNLILRSRSQHTRWFSKIPVHQFQEGSYSRTNLRNTFQNTHTFNSGIS